MGERLATMVLTLVTTALVTCGIAGLADDDVWATAICAFCLGPVLFGLLLIVFGGDD